MNKRIRLIVYIPVLVEATLALLRQVLGPNGLESTHAFRCVNVSDKADDDHWRSFEHGHSLDNLLLVNFGAGLVDLTHNVRHAGFVRQKGREVHRFGWVILREGLNLTTMTLAALLGCETHVPMTGR